MARADAGAVRWRAVSGLWCRRIREKLRGIVALGAVAEDGDDLGGGREVAGGAEEGLVVEADTVAAGDAELREGALAALPRAEECDEGGVRQRLGEAGMQRAELKFGGRAHWRD